MSFTSPTDELKNEARILQKLKHPNVVSYFGWYQDSDLNQYLVLEFCAYGSLNSFLEREKNVSEEMQLSMYVLQKNLMMFY